jgi:hypothetical protein
MPAAALIAGAFLLLVGVFVLFHMRRLWLHAPTRLDDDNLHGASFAPFWRAYRRALPIFAILFVPMLTLILVLGAINGGPIDGMGLNIVFVLAVSSIAFAASVVLVNKPKTVVPPHLRGEPGLFRDLRSQKS